MPRVLLTNSLALISDAVHLLTDIAALCLALLTLWISTRPASGGKTYGYLRAEILGALANGVFLWLLVIFIWFEAVQRLRNPQPVEGLAVIAIATVGLGVNSFSAWMTHAAGTAEGRPGMAVRAVFVHVLSDLIGTFGVMLAGALVYFFQWHQADALISLLIGALVLYSSWGLVREGVDILMESVPGAYRPRRVAPRSARRRGRRGGSRSSRMVPGRRQFALSRTRWSRARSTRTACFRRCPRLLRAKFNIHHMTVQLERDSRRRHEPEHF